MARCTAFLCALASLVLAGCGAGSLDTGFCTRVPQTIPPNRVIANGITTRAPVGTLLWVALAESANLSDTGNPSGFPWLPPTSSDHSVLTPVRLCPLHGMYSLREKLAAFRAVGRGTATLLARLAPPWRGHAHAPPTYRAVVVVGS